MNIEISEIWSSTPELIRVKKTNLALLQYLLFIISDCHSQVPDFESNSFIPESLKWTPPSLKLARTIAPNKVLSNKTHIRLGGSVGCAVRLETRRSRVQPPPRSATFFRGD